MMKRVTMLGALALMLALGQNGAWAQATITLDGDLSDWSDEMRLDVPPNRPIITWQDGADGRDNSPADPSNLNHMVDLNFAGLYATDDAEYLYVRVDMNPLADVRRVWTDLDMYPANQRIELFISIDPDLLLDFADTTGMTWGWYFSGVDYSIPLYPIDEAYQDTTGYQVAVAEHTQENNEWSFVAPHPKGGAYVTWNEAHNVAEIAIPKAVLLQPQYLANYSTEFVSLWLQSGAHNTVDDNPWWQQSATTNDDMLGYIYTYTTEWTGVATEREELAGSFVLDQNYPNPFNPSTTIRFTMKEASNVTVEVFDLLGRHRATLMNAPMVPGTHEVEFNAGDLESGIYLYKVTAGGVSSVRTMTLIK
ncbi:MAG TPA: T9SS type A sorting domain-containing protein [Rhodothermales bacterium]